MLSYRRNFVTMSLGEAATGVNDCYMGVLMRGQTKPEWFRSALPTVSWTLVCLLAMSLVVSILVAGT